MHTERQLIIQALQDSVGQNGNPLAANGTLYIYTRRPPCCESTRANGYYGCYQYYERLARACVNVQFEVYFNVDAPSAGIDTHVLTTASNADIAVVVGIIRTALGINTNAHNSFRTDNSGRLYMSNGMRIMNRIGTMVANIRKMNPQLQSLFIRNLNEAIKLSWRNIPPTPLSEQNINAIISTLYKINGVALPANLHYHVTN